MKKKEFTQKGKTGCIFSSILAKNLKKGNSSSELEILIFDSCEYLYGPWSHSSVLTHKKIVKIIIMTRIVSNNIELSNGIRFKLFFEDNWIFYLESALVNWLARTTKYNAKSFVNYVKNKQPYLKIYTESQWNKHQLKLLNNENKS